MNDDLPAGSFFVSQECVLLFSIGYCSLCDQQHAARCTEMVQNTPFRVT